MKIPLLLVIPALIACGGSGNNQPEVLNQPMSGVIPIANYSDGTSTGFQYSIAPVFIDAPPADVCTIQTSGVCKILSCPGARDGLQPSSAGTLDISVGGTALAPLPGMINGYMNVLTQGSLFNGGETISISASGAIIPAFSGSVTAPSPIMVTAPLGASLAISQSQDLTVSWTGTSAGVVVFQLEQTDATTQAQIDVQCELPTTPTSAVIPATALAQVAQGSYTADIYTRTRDEVNPGGWNVLLEGQYHAGVSGVGAYKRPAVVGQ